MHPNLTLIAMRLFSLLLLLALIVLPTQAQSFDQYFEDNTLRLDYIFAGNDSVQGIYLEHLYKQPQWAGRKARLAEKFLQGNGQLTVRDQATQEVIYVWTFSTLFQEWLNEDEAKQVNRAFECSYNIPYPVLNLLFQYLPLEFFLNSSPDTLKRRTSV